MYCISGFIEQMRKFCRTTAKEGDNTVRHLNKLKQCRNRINLTAIGYRRFGIPDNFFIATIAQSLPPSWDSFVEDCFLGDDYGEKIIGPQRFMDAIEREYLRREATHITTYAGQLSVCYYYFKLILLS